MNSNVNPYANANAPPVPPYPSGDNGDHHRASYGSNLGYPPYPGSSANGYPSQSTNQAGRQPDLGYPPYPTQNRMPVPGQPIYPQNSGYPPPGNYPQQYPGYQNNYPYQNYPNQQRGYSNHPNSIYRKGAAPGIIASMILVGFSGLIHFFVVTPWWFIISIESLCRVLFVSYYCCAICRSYFSKSMTILIRKILCRR